MSKNYRKLKSIVLSMVLAAGMMLPASSFAQEVVAETGGGVFGFGKLFGSEGLFSESELREGEEFDISNYGIGETEDAPLGSGIAILLGAGLGYVALKKKED